MKKILSTMALSTLVCLGVANAQSGMTAGQDGLHQINANTLGQWNVVVGTGGNVAVDNWAMTRAGVFKNDQGEIVPLYQSNGSFAGAFSLALGLFNWMDAGLNLPIHYDYAGSPSRDVDNYNMNALSRGDLDLWFKAKLPIGNDSSVFSSAVLAQVYFPTGEEGVGLRPRHAWYLNKNITNPYTANAFALALNGIFTFDFSKRGIPLRWNTQIGYLHVFEDDQPDVLLYSTGFNLLAHRLVDLFLEFSGEMRVQEKGYELDPIVDPMLVTPGLRFHINHNIDFGIGLEVAVRTFKNLKYDLDEELKGSEDYTITFQSEHGRKATYGYASTPLIAGAATLVYRFGNDDEAAKAKSDSLLQAKVDSILAKRAAQNDSLSKLDSDKDGVNDLKDLCSNTREGASVDTNGCPIDTDKDGVPDGLDKCPSTVAGVPVDSTGCEPDFDKDGIPDSKDKCPNTPAGTGVDSTGCSSDSDKDGIADAMDKCPNTPAGITVNAEGCPLDFDKDGVFDVFDKCPNTKAGESVDSTGCSLDGDKDGVPDGLDKCPNTENGISVDSTGCPLDFDKDGIPDSKDKCPNTLPGIKIDSDGCPINKKQDLDQLKKGIQFKLNSAKLTKKSFGTLDDIIKLMNQIPEANLEVQGHTDELGSDETNQKLSQQRAQTVVDYFIKKGIDSNRLRAVGYGASKPVADNKSKKGREKNRRVELVPFSRD
ncbi:MAG: OmpA family protein [Fibrobacteraceae bacterium]|nr:OmpA family protein [Fibrobacteraceae bacterium]